MLKKRIGWFLVYFVTFFLFRLAIYKFMDEPPLTGSRIAGFVITDFLTALLFTFLFRGKPRDPESGEKSGSNRDIF